MQPSNLMGAPTPNKTTPPPSGEVGEGEIREIVKCIYNDVYNAVVDEVLRVLFGEDIAFITPSENEWNGWLETKEGLKTFRAGAYLDYLVMEEKVLTKLIDALETLLGDVKKKRERIEAEWREKVGYTQTQ